MYRRYACLPSACLPMSQQRQVGKAGRQMPWWEGVGKEQAGRFGWACTKVGKGAAGKGKAQQTKQCMKQQRQAGMHATTAMGKGGNARAQKGAGQGGRVGVGRWGWVVGRQ